MRALIITLQNGGSGDSGIVWSGTLTVNGILDLAWWRGQAEKGNQGAIVFLTCSYASCGGKAISLLDRQRGQYLLLTG